MPDRIIVLAICFFACLTASAQAALSPVSSEAVMIQLEQRWLQAIEQHDIAFLNSLLDDDFVDTAPDGRLRSKQDVLAAPVARKYESQTLRNLKVHLHGDVAIVNGMNVIVGKDHSHTVKVHFTDVFQERHGQWKAIVAQENVSAK